MKVKDFLKLNHFTLESYSFKEDVAIFIKEMESGLAGEASISMLPTFIQDKRDIPREKPILVLDAGGTNFRAAIVKFDAEKNPIITDYRKRAIPGIEREYTKEEFFDAITSFVENIAKNIDTIGFCFSYAMKKNQKKDGRLIHFSKEIKAPEVEGQLIGQGVLDSFKRKNITNIKKIILLNDTVATQLAGKIQDKSNKYGFFAGIILGTGVNACYNEKNINITKEKTLEKKGSQIINTEVGSCRIVPYGNIDEEFRSITEKPETYHLEKMVSGGYIGKLWFFTLYKAAVEGLFSKNFSAKICKSYSVNGIKDIDASDLSRLFLSSILPDGLKEFADAEDIKKAFEIGLTIVKRAAYIASVMIFSIVQKMQKEKDQPVVLCIDGSTFWKLTGLKDMIEKRLKSELDKVGISYKILKIENAPLIGAAVAGLTN